MLTWTGLPVIPVSPLMSFARSVLLACAFICAWPAAAAPEEGIGRLFRRLVAPGEPEFLAPDDAFVLMAGPSGPRRITVRWQIADGYYLYRDKFNFAIENDLVSVSGVSLPRGDMEDDPDFGHVEVNRGVVEAAVTLERQGAAELPVDLVVGYQGCKEDTLCYPPVTKILPLILPALVEPVSAATGLDEARPSVTGKYLSEQDAISEGLKDNSLLVNIVVFFGFGLLLAFTPCVFPMVPILSGIIVGQGSQITAYRAFFLSLSYVLAVAITYSILGLLAGSLRLNLQAAAQNAWVIVVFSGVFVLLALSMFGFYELRLPARWLDRLTAAGSKHRRGSLQGAAAMGLLSAIIVGPCVAPPLAGALLYISQAGNPVLGGAALLAMGLGMGVPLLVVGTAEGKVLPRAGRWMEAIRHVFGVLMLGVAVWFLGRVLPGPVTLALWALLFIVSAIFMGALDRPVPGTRGWQRLWTGIGLAMLVYGATLLVGAAGGGTDVLRPLQGIAGTGHPAPALEFTPVKNVAELDDMLAFAARNGQAVMLDVYADWCVECRRLEKHTFRESAVRAVLRDVLLLKADVTANDEQDSALLQRLDLFGPPAILFFREGRERRAYRIIGYVDAEIFVRHVREVIAS